MNRLAWSFVDEYEERVRSGGDPYDVLAQLCRDSYPRLCPDEIEERLRATSIFSEDRLYDVIYQLSIDAYPAKITTRYNK